MRIAQGQLVLNRQFDVDALDSVGVFAQALQRNHHVFVDFKGVGVLGNGGGAAAVEPEGFAGIGRYAIKPSPLRALASFTIWLRRRLARRFRRPRHDVGQQHHFGAAFARLALVA
jgi:hypothetical protein